MPPLLLTFLFIGLSTTGAHAYLDGGTGSMILQLLLGGVAGLALAFRLYWYRLLSLLGIKSKSATSDGKESVSKSQALFDR